MIDTSQVPCHYAAQPGSRPYCQVTAVIRRGAIPLCASCDTLRSTLGKGQPGTPLPAPATASVLDWISQARTQLDAAQAELTAAVTRARQAGHSWTTIAAHLDITRQAAQLRRPLESAPSRRGQMKLTQRPDPRTNEITAASEECDDPDCACRQDTSHPRPGDGAADVTMTEVYDIEIHWGHHPSGW